MGVWWYIWSNSKNLEIFKIITWHKLQMVIYCKGSRERRYAPLAQLVEHLTLNQGVQGSNPWWCTKNNMQTLKTQYYYKCVLAWCGHLKEVNLDLLFFNYFSFFHVTKILFIKIVYKINFRSNTKFGFTFYNFSYNIIKFEI